MFKNAQYFFWVSLEKLESSASQVLLKLQVANSHNINASKHVALKLAEKREDGQLKEGELEFS